MLIRLVLRKSHLLNDNMILKLDRFDVYEVGFGFESLDISQRRRKIIIE